MVHEFDTDLDLDRDKPKAMKMMDPTSKTTPPNRPKSSGATKPARSPKEAELWAHIDAYRDMAIDAARSKGEVAQHYLQWAQSNLRDALREALKPAAQMPPRNSDEATQALKLALSVCMSIRTGIDRRVLIGDGTMFAQTAEWCKWVEETVAPKLRAAIESPLSPSGALEIPLPGSPLPSGAALPGVANGGTPVDKGPGAGSDPTDAIVTELYRRFKDWHARGFGPDDVTWCEVRASVEKLIGLAVVERDDEIVRLRDELQLACELKRTYQERAAELAQGPASATVSATISANPLPAAERAEPTEKQWLWRVFNQGYPQGHESGSNEWGAWSLISDEDARRLAAEDDAKAYQFVEYVPAAPSASPDAAPGRANQISNKIATKKARP